MKKCLQIFDKDGKKDSGHIIIAPNAEQMAISMALIEKMYDTNTDGKKGASDKSKIQEVADEKDIVIVVKPPPPI